MNKLFYLPKGKALCYAIIASAISGLTSCSNEIDSPDSQNDYSIEMNAPAVVYVKNGVIASSNGRATVDNGVATLAFKTDRQFYEFYEEFQSLSDEQKWSKINLLGVKNIYDLAINADTELDSIGENAASENDFREKYEDYVEKYKGILIRNYEDATDLTLYVPEDLTDICFIANECGEYVIGGEVKKVELAETLPESVLALNQVSTLAEEENINSYSYKPKSGKRVKFSIDRKYDTVKISMSTQKKMWYGWKNDPHREYIIEPHFTSGNFKLRVPYYIRYWAKSKNGINDEWGDVTDANPLSGTIYTWTDMTAETDENGDMIIEDFYGSQGPRCLYEKSKTVTVYLPKTK